MSYMIVGARAALGAIFLVSAVSKSRSRVALREFREAMVTLAPWTARGAVPAASSVLVAEWAVVVTVTVPVWPDAVVAGGFAAACVLLGVFAVALAVAVSRAVAVGCRCFGSTSRPVNRVQVLRNVITLIIAAVGCADLVLNGGVVGGVSPADGAIAVAAGLALALLLISMDDLAHLFVDETYSQATVTPLARR